MASRSVAFLPFLFITVISSMRGVVPSSSMCPHESVLFLNNLQQQCSPSISPCPPVEVDGSFLDRALASTQRNAYVAVLFYASWCPFSCSVRPKFETLSYMFPQVEHYAVEQSSALPSVFSRYGIHSFPSILIVNQTSRVRYHGQKDFPSVLQFYEKTTGLEPVQYVAEDEPIRSGGSNNCMTQSWNEQPLEIFEREPYLTLAMLFLCLRVCVLIVPKVISCLKDFWASYVPHLNLEIFGETSQLFGRVLYMIDVRRAWTKLRLCKTRNFQERARNARVWASSLASVSLGESSSGRSTSSS